MVPLHGWPSSCLAGWHLQTCRVCDRRASRPCARKRGGWARGSAYKTRTAVVVVVVVVEGWGWGRLGLVKWNMVVACAVDSNVAGAFAAPTFVCVLCMASTAAWFACNGIAGSTHCGCFIQTGQNVPTEAVGDGQPARPLQAILAPDQMVVHGLTLSGKQA
jgi:hypothetical protein